MLRPISKDPNTNDDQDDKANEKVRINENLHVKRRMNLVKGIRKIPSFLQIEVFVITMQSGSKQTQIQEKKKSTKNKHIMTGWLEYLASSTLQWVSRWIFIPNKTAAKKRREIFR